MGYLTDLIDAWAREHELAPTQTQVAAALGVTRQSLLGWRAGGTLPRAQHLARVARVTGHPYVSVLDAALRDGGYLPGPGSERPGTLVEVRARSRRATVRKTAE